MPSVLQLYTSALNDCGALAAGQTPSGTIIGFARECFADVVRAWSEIRLRLFFVPEAEYDLTAGRGVYEIGPGGAQFDTDTGNFVRPVLVETGVVIVGVARRLPLSILSRPEWQKFPFRTLEDPDGPLVLFYDYNIAKATFNFGPIPQVPCKVFLSQWNPLKVFNEGDEALEVLDFYPEAYLLPLKIALAVRMSPTFRFQISQDLLGLLQSGISIIESKNREKLEGAFSNDQTLSIPTKGYGTTMGINPQTQQPPPGQ